MPLAAARLYFVCEAQPRRQRSRPLLEAAIAGGVDVIQLREKAPRCAEELIAFADPFARAAREFGALFFLNDEPELVAALRRRRRPRRPGRRACVGGARGGR